MMIEDDSLVICENEILKNMNIRIESIFKNYNSITNIYFEL